ncbi:hypothetical protein F2P56_003364 [Juglans regia]|uniref:Uncharacterized protein n=1 Tax=Juglans regia TaxID=51240 RepID=A0A834D6V3_JUGRE|nr:hypothetical protein F2P56_003364 [Juglans regia]
MGQSGSNLVVDSNNTGRESGFQSPPIPNTELDRAPSNPDRPADERTLVIEENLQHLDFKEVSEPVLKQEDEKAGNWDLKEADEVLEGEKENGPSNWEEGMGGGSEYNGWGDYTNPQVPWIVTDDNGNENETVTEDGVERNGAAFTEIHQYGSLKTPANGFGPNCKFSRRARRKNKAVMEKVKEKEESMVMPGQTECKAVMEKVKKKEESMAMPGQTESKVVKEKVKEPGKSTERPVQTECKVVKEKVKKLGKSTERPGQTECKVVKEKVKEPGKSTERPGQTGCKVVKEKVKEPGKSTERPGQTGCKVVKEKVKEPGKSTERPGLDARLLRRR